jgi:hypothetical protein
MFGLLSRQCLRAIEALCLGAMVMHAATVCYAGWMPDAVPLINPY